MMTKKKHPEISKVTTLHLVIIHDCTVCTAACEKETFCLHGAQDVGAQTSFLGGCVQTSTAMSAVKYEQGLT